MKKISRKPGIRAKNREILYKALVDPKFRKLLEVSPEEALKQKKLTPVQKQEARLILTIVQSIRYKIAKLADEILCANGPCGIA